MSKTPSERPPRPVLEYPGDTLSPAEQRDKAYAQARTLAVIAVALMVALLFAGCSAYRNGAALSDAEDSLASVETSLAATHELAQLRGDANDALRSEVDTLTLQAERLQAELDTATADADELRVKLEDAQSTLKAAQEALKRKSDTPAPSTSGSVSRGSSERTAATPAPTASPPGGSHGLASVEQWRPIVERWFTVNPESAMCVMAYGVTGNGESKGNPNAKSSTNDHGLFQINACHKAWFEREFGVPFFPNIYDPTLNIRAAAMMTKGGADWSSWSCKPCKAHR